MITLGLVLTAFLVSVVLTGLACLLASHVIAWRHFRAPASPPLPTPPPAVSILKPVEGAGPETYEAFASFCRLDYPGRVELLIGTLRADDPIVPVVDKLRAAFPDQGIRLIQAQLRGTNRKTSIMEALWQASTGELLFFSDADVVAAPDYLRQLVPQLLEPGVGCLTCLPRGIRTSSIGGRLVALHYAFSYLPQWMLATRTTGIHWAVGPTMAVPRTVLERIKGFTGFLDHLADDYELGHRVDQLGLKVVLPPQLIDCHMPVEGLPAAFRRLLRWKRTMRRARGPAFLGSGLTYPLFWSLVLAAIHPSAAWTWGLVGGVTVIRVVLAAGLQRLVRFPDWRAAWWRLPMLDLLEGVTFLGAYSGRTVHWAGRRYRLLPDGTLSQPLDGPPAGRPTDAGSGRAR